MTKLFEAEDYIRRPESLTVDGVTSEMAGWLVKQATMAGGYGRSDQGSLA